MADATKIFVDVHTHHRREDILSPTMAGIHPWDATKGVALPNPLSADVIGEIGLDYACDVERSAQLAIFRKQLLLAEELRKPVVLHVVRAMEDTLKVVAEYNLQAVVFHGFIGSREQAERCLKRGYYLSFGTRSLRSTKTLRALEYVPLDRLFVESDDDAQLDIRTLYDAIARIKGISVDELLHAIRENYNRLITHK